MEGTWERDAVDEPFRLFDADGNPAVVPPGVPWISVFPGAAGRHLVVSPLPATAAGIAAAVASGEVTAAAVVAAHLEAIDRRGDLNAFTLVDGEGARAAAAALDRRLAAGEAAGPAGRGAGGPQGPHRPGRPPHHLRVVLLPEGRRRPRPPWCAAWKRRGRSSWAAPACTSSPSASPARTPGGGRCATPGTPAPRRAGRREARPPPWPAGWRRWGSAPTPEARSGCRPPSAAWWASRSPTAASRSPASSPWPRRWTPSAR